MSIGYMFPWHLGKNKSIVSQKISRQKYLQTDGRTWWFQCTVVCVVMKGHLLHHQHTTLLIYMQGFCVWCPGEHWNHFIFSLGVINDFTPRNTFTGLCFDTNLKVFLHVRGHNIWTFQPKYIWSRFRFYLVGE